MTIHIETPSRSSSYPDGFEALAEAYARNRPTLHDYTFESYALADTVLLDTPPDVLATGEILTNPSPIKTVPIPVGDELLNVPFAYFRREPTTLHLGKTTSIPYLLRQNGKDTPYCLSEFTEAITLPGEDPRVMQGVKLRGHDGKVHSGWCVSTVIATAKLGNPADVESIKQVFFWGETLGSLEPILEIPDLKNTCIYPLSNVTGDDADTRLDVFGRPHPHITHAQAPELGSITKELVLSGTNLTEGFLPPGVHTGVNTVKGVPGCPNLRELDIHEAYAPVTPEGKILHYRLGRYVVDLSTHRLVPLGVIATRADFPDAPPKPPENGIVDYYDIVYGSLGNPKLGLMVTGVSDRHIGLARVVKTS